MSRADEVRERYDAELAVIELEEQLTAAKADKKADAAEVKQLKADLREARQAWRELRAGAVEVAPEVTSTSAAVEEN